MEASKKKKIPNERKLSELKTLGEQLLSSREHVNNLTILLSYISETSKPEHALESLLSLQAFFTPLIPQLPSSNANLDHDNNNNNNNKEFMYKAWLRSKFDDFLNSLINLAVSSQSDHALREVVLDTIMEFVKLGKGCSFNSAIYHKLLHTLTHSKLVVDDMISDLLVSKYFNYHDVRYFTYISLEKLSRTSDKKSVSDDQGIIRNANSENQSSESMELSIHKMHHLLSNIPPFEGENVKSEYETWSGLGSFVKKGNHINDIGSSKPEDKAHKRQKSDEKVLSAASVLKKMKLKFTKAWISFLRLPLPLDVYKKVLVSLHQDVIPSLSNPIMLCDFLTRSYDIGGVVSVMALSSLFILMTQHGLEYPNFYEKLYALLEPSIFMAKHRAKFFELLDSCLKSPLLPAYLAAAFSKKLSRVALCVPPSGALVIIALIHNLLRRHPSINCLVHKEDGKSAEEDSESKMKHSKEEIAASRNKSSNIAGIDHFDNEHANPLNSNAMRSSLWEIDTLRHHYCPPVSRFVLSLENDLTVRARTTEVAVKDFSSGSYATIFNDEIMRRVKQVPLAFYKSTPITLFSESDFPGWTFNSKDEEATSLNDESCNKRLSEGQDRLATKRQRIECS